MAFGFASASVIDLIGATVRLIGCQKTHVCIVNMEGVLCHLINSFPHAAEATHVDYNHSPRQFSVYFVGNLRCVDVLFCDLVLQFIRFFRLPNDIESMKVVVFDLLYLILHLVMLLIYIQMSSILYTNV